MNSCSSLKGLYIARHGRLVDQIPCTAEEQTFKHTTVQANWFNSPANTFLGIANKPDIVNIKKLHYLRCHVLLICLWRTLTPLRL